MASLLTVENIQIARVCNFFVVRKVTALLILNLRIMAVNGCWYDPSPENVYILFMLEKKAKWNGLCLHVSPWILQYSAKLIAMLLCRHYV